uniref:tRNA phosphotransferase 1 n=1 Tax=Otus sunia TaxID=257818 RepID=A0A8C8AC61_9STRI
MKDGGPQCTVEAPGGFEHHYKSPEGGSWGSPGVWGSLGCSREGSWGSLRCPPGRAWGSLGDWGVPGCFWGSQVPALELTPLRTPEALPPTLAHGTRRRLWAPIRAGGLAPMGRTHIHLAPGLPGDPGVRSGMRPDSEIAIIIDGPRALAEGIPFFCSANGVILTPGDKEGRLPPKYFLRVLQLRPYRCQLPLEGPLHEEGGERLSHEDGASLSHEGRGRVSTSHEVQQKPINRSQP